MAEGKLHIHLHLYDTDLSVNVPREDEVYYRDAATLITEVVNTYANLFRGRKSDKEVLYMALLDIALRYQKEKDRNDTEPFHNILSKLTSEIEDALK
ncbi:MAG: cell division protein ZapA [Prevotella sp.]|nr:cell division protein ZapA [Prevotella sp.]